jgi:hypothetical protein
MSLTAARKFKLAGPLIGPIGSVTDKRLLTNWIDNHRGPRLINSHTTDLSTNTTSHNVNVGSPADGEMVLIAFRTTVAATVTPPGGWSTMVDFGSGDQLVVVYRRCDGTEGATETFGTNVNSRAAAVALRYLNAGSPVLATFVFGTTTTNPSHHAIHQGVGVRDMCFLSLATWEGGATVSSRPSGYSNNSPSAGEIVNTGSSGAGLATVAWTMKFARQSRDATGSWSISVNSATINCGVAIPPG